MRDRTELRIVDDKPRFGGKWRIDLIFKPHLTDNAFTKYSRYRFAVVKFMCKKGSSYDGGKRSASWNSRKKRGREKFSRFRCAVTFEPNSFCLMHRSGRGGAGNLLKIIIPSESFCIFKRLVSPRLRRSDPQFRNFAFQTHLEISLKREGMKLRALGGSKENRGY